MRVAINVRSILKSLHTGIGRYTANLVQSLVNIDSKNQYVMYAPKKFFDFHKRFPKFKAKNLSCCPDWNLRGPARKLSGIDIYHVPHPDMIEPMPNARVVVTVHDFVYKAFSQGHTEQTLALTDAQMKSFLPFVDRIICCSENTRRDLHRFFEIDSKKTCVVYQGVDKNIFFPLKDHEKVVSSLVLKDLGVRRPYILFVGTIEPRKNLKRLLDAFALIKSEGNFNGDLVVVGMKGWKSDDINPHINNLGIAGNVIFTGFVSDSDLRCLYNECEVFVFPSFYEGFGYPILEAMCCGAAVVSSGAASCSEVAGEAAVLIEDPSSVRQIVDAIMTVIGNPDFKRVLRKKSLVNAQNFSFEKNARETLAVYYEVMEQSR